MACCRKPLISAFLVLGFVALGLHLAGFVTPGWMVVKVSQEFFVQEDVMIGGEIMERRMNPDFGKDMDDEDSMSSDDDDDDSKQPIDFGGVVPPSMDDMDTPRPHPTGKPRPHPTGKPEPRPTGKPHPRPHPGPHPGPGPHPHHKKHHKKHHHHGPPHEEEDEMTQIGQFFIEAQVEFGVDIESEVHVGLWYSRICMRPPKREGGKDEDEDDSSSSEEEGRHGKKHRCKCKRISTRCAIYAINRAKDMQMGDMEYRHKPRLDYHRLTEHRVETTVALALLVVAIVAAIAARCRKDVSKANLLVCALAMLVAVVLIFIPAGRAAHYSHLEKSHDFRGFRARCPYSVLASGLGGLVALVATVVAFVAVCVMKRRQKGEFYRFTNEDEMEDKKQQCKNVFIDFPQFSSLKPVETISEPEKKPLE